jgi:hypothetical protein
MTTHVPGLTQAPFQASFMAPNFSEIEVIRETRHVQMNQGTYTV